MRGLLPEEHEKRLMLYHQGLSDAEIARRAGVTGAAVYHWRKKNNLTVNVMPAMRMDDVLTPDQCEIMREFLRFCVTGWRHGATDVIKLMRAYREYQSGFVCTRLNRRVSA